jgi:hypothetical protein
MKTYAASEKNARDYSPKFTGAGYRTPARRWLKRCLHKSARTQTKQDLRELQEEPA